MNQPINYQKLIYLLIGISTLPFLVLLSQIKFGLSVANPVAFWNNFIFEFANIAGFIGAILLLWQMILGSRWIMSKFTPDTIGMNMLHRRLGTYGLLAVLFHPILEVYKYSESWRWLFWLSGSSKFEQQVTFGRIALILFLIVWITSALLRGRLKYRPWLYIHYLTYPLMGFVLIHAVQLGSYLGDYLYLKVIWYLMMAIFVGLVIQRLAIFVGWGATKYQLTDKQLVGNQVVLLTLKPLGKRLDSAIGQHFYLQLRRFSLAHPFTIMEHDDQTGNLIFGIKAMGKFTNLAKSLKIDQTIFVSGPYGVFTREAQNNEPKVIIAGGIGVTPFIRLVKRFGENVTFFYCNPTIEEAVGREEIIKAIGNNYYDVLSDSKNEAAANVIIGRINAEHITKVLAPDDIARRHYFICGSKDFIRSVEAMLKSLGVKNSKIYYEEFGF
ncbi:MAG: ferredoxin reductase family protein [Patescibacteria group bacterium]|jgi:predicted ferric reductase|nr:ferredoxin reductase family protein [Patescibacteria group bacterium]